jgi:hypothetical protein
MDARQQDYSQSGLSSPYPTFPDPASEDTSADQASAAQYPPQGPDPRASNLTPTSDYSLNPSSARSGSFPDYIQRSYQPGAQGQAPGGMAQQQSPSMPLSDGHSNDHHQQQQLKSDSDVPIDPSIAAATSPTYSHQQQYSPYTPHHDMQHYPGHPQTPMYASRPEWAGQYAQPGMHYGHPATSGPPAPAMVSPVQRPPTVSHFCASTGIGYAPRHLFQERESCFASFPEVCSLACTLELLLTTRIGRTSSLYCVLFRSHSWCATTQATASTI